jgi:type I restriction enzyme, S subunit
MLSTRWPAVPIEDLCARVTSGGTPSRSNPAYYDGGTIPWIKTGELRGWYVDEIAERITTAAVRESSAKVFPPETVLLAMYGDGKTMGSVGLVRTPAATNQACCAMLADPQKCDPKFLMYSLVYFKPAILKLAISGAQRNLNGKSIKQFAIGAPPVAVQQRIASILSAYDDLIENNTRRIAILEEMARRIYEEWFVRFRFPGHQGVRMVESELGLVPEGWPVVRLDDVLVLQRGFDLPKQDRTEGPFPIISATGASASHIEYKVKGPGVVTGRSGSLGTVMYVEGDFWPLNTTLWVKQFAVGSPLYAFYVLQSIDLVGFNSGAAVPTLNRNDVHGLPVVRPTPEVLSAFDEAVGPMIKLKRRLELKQENLRTTRDFLLPKLISGELDVSALPEPEALTA